MRHHLLIAAVLSFTGMATLAGQHDMPAGMTHEQHEAQMRKDAAMKERGARAMGFDQDRTVHHFLLQADGGIISVEVIDPTDTGNRDAIRAHLRQIAVDFANGRFDAPFATHGEEPSGTPVMRAARASIRYLAEETPGGARVRITSSDRAAIDAIHDFLVYQIREHHTGDPTRRP